MSLPAQVPRAQIVSAGGQTVFPFVFRCDDSTQILAWVGDVQQGGIIVALNADQVAAPGGTVTLAAQAAGAIVTVERVNPQTQTLALTAYGPFAAAAITLALDKMVELLQEFWAVLTTAVRVSRNNAGNVASTDLPNPQLGALIGWIDAGGGRFKLGNIIGFAQGELLTDSGDHIHFTSAHAPVGPGLVYRNGQRIFLVDDFTFASPTWTLLVALGAGEKLNADYPY